MTTSGKDEKIIANSLVTKQKQLTKSHFITTKIINTTTNNNNNINKRKSPCLVILLSNYL